MVSKFGISAFPGGLLYFQVPAVSFREGPWLLNHQLDPDSGHVSDPFSVIKACGMAAPRCVKNVHVEGGEEGAAMVCVLCMIATHSDYDYLDLPRGAEWMMFGVPKNTIP